MLTQNYSLAQFADLIARETQRGIIDGMALMNTIDAWGLPSTILDKHGDVRMELERDGEDLRVTKHLTPMVEERLLTMK